MIPDFGDEDYGPRHNIAGTSLYEHPQGKPGTKSRLHRKMEDAKQWKESGQA